MPPNGGQGDVSLTREGAWRMVLRKDEVEIGDSGLGDSPDEQTLPAPLRFRAMPTV